MRTAEHRRFLMRRRESGLTSEQVAEAAGLALAEEYRAEIGCVVESEVATRLLAAFSRLTGRNWTMEEAAINTRQEGM
jgi:hypothetical protein